MDFHSPAEQATKKPADSFTLFVDLKNTLQAHLAAVREQRENHPTSKPYLITEQMIKNLDESFEAIRAASERFDYTIFSASALKVSELLKKLRTPVQYRRTDIFNELTEVLENIEQMLKEKSRTT